MLTCIQTDTVIRGCRPGSRELLCNLLLIFSCKDIFRSPTTNIKKLYNHIYLKTGLFLKLFFKSLICGSVFKFLTHF